MKKIVCLIAMALFTATGCTSVEMNQTKTDTPDDNTQGNATTLSCADYTLNPLWNWAETPANQLIVIRSQAELADFIFPNDKLPEDIDFEKNTLLLVAGQATNGIESVKKNFVKADAQYIYSVTFLLNDTTKRKYRSIWRLISPLLHCQQTVAGRREKISHIRYFPDNGR